MEPEFFKLAPNDVSIHSARLYLRTGSPEEFESMDNKLEEAAELLATAQVDVIIYGCTAGGVKDGAKSDFNIIDRIEKTSGIPAVSTSRAVIEALNFLKATKICIATPYDDKLNQKVAAFCEGNGVHVLSIHGLGYSKGSAWRKETSETIYGFAKKASLPEADSLFISCTDLPAIDLIQTLENFLGIPVISSNSATMWASLRKIGWGANIQEYGTLLANITNPTLISKME